MVGIIGVAIPHHGVRDDGVDLDTGHAGAAAGDRPQNVGTSARSNDGKLSVRTKDVRECRWRGHQVLLPIAIVPMARVGIHDVSGSVGVDDYGFRAPLTI